MADVVFVVGLAAGMLLVPMLVWTLFDREFRIWPTPAPGSWQSRTFWTLFRTLNVAAIVCAVVADSGFLKLPEIVRFVGLVMLFGATALYLSAWITLGKRNTYCEPEGLVTTGIYRWTRNPQYASVIPLFLGLAVAADSASTYILVAILVSVYVLMALTEEPWLEEAFGERYRKYCRRVPRFFNWHRAYVLLLTTVRHLQRQPMTKALLQGRGDFASGFHGRKRM
jgi:protein-S-isoprenylcysteine O-methyltransferase Ste14